MEKLSIDTNEILRYLGYKGMDIDANTLVLIQECKNELLELVIKRYQYKFFKINRMKDRIILEDTSMTLTGQDIYNHLEASRECILMAVTLGSSVEKQIKYYSKINLTKAVIFDACANTAIEEICNDLCIEIENNLRNQEKKITSRYSPGYGDLSLDMQKKIIRILEADKSIGLTASSNNILLPQKSVTAIVGIIDINKRVTERDCTICNMYKSCNFRKEGQNCGT